MKRYLSLFLALILCLSLLTVALGDGDEESGGQSECQHEWKADTTKSKAATCESPGLKAEYCDKCQITRESEIPALGHSWGKWMANSDGETHSHTCGVCKKTDKANHVKGETWEKDEENHWKKCSECGAEFEKAAHTFDKTKWEKDNAKHWQVCTVCGYSTKDTKAENHKWDSGKVTKAATCVTQGVKTYTCTVCGATKTETIPLTEHSWDGGKTTIAPTITEKGESTFKCIVCGKVATREIAPLGLSMTPEELLTVQNMTGNALGGRLDDEKWVILQGVATEEEYARIQGGWPITVTLKVTDITNTVGEELTEEVQNAAGKQKIYCFLKMELSKELYQDPPIPVTGTTEPIILSLTLPEEIQEATSKRKERGFTVYRIDGDQAEKVAAQLSEDGQSLRLQTNTFGTYALTYHDTSTGSFDPMLLLYGAVGLVTLGGIGFLVYKLFIAPRREEYNEDDE